MSIASSYIPQDLVRENASITEASDQTVIK
jgi:hypothetical protein